MVVEILLAVILASATGYQAGKASQKVESVESGSVCFDHEYNGREAKCYSVEKVSLNK